MKTFIGNIVTPSGRNYLTAVNGGGLGGPDAGAGVSPCTQTQPPPARGKTFTLILQPGSPPIGPGMRFALRTSDGAHYLTAVNGGGIGGPNDGTCPVHTDATTAGAWEIFYVLVDDTVNPPTAKLMLFNVAPNLGFEILGSRYVTAVDGGGVAGSNAQPVNTSATAVGPDQVFTFASLLAAPPATSIPIYSLTNINGPANGNIAGSLSLTMSEDGSYNFSGKDNNSNWFPYNMSVALAVVSSKGTLLAFTYSGNIDAGLPWDNNNLSWSLTGNNAAIQARWAEFQAGYTWYYNISASLSLGDLWNAVTQAVSAAGTVVQVAVAVVGAFS